MAPVDFSIDAGNRALQRFRDEQIIWLTTVNAEGQPQSSPVWFLWRNDGFTFYSQPKAPKLTSIQVNPRVALNLNASESGLDVVTFEGIAMIVQSSSPSTEDRAFVERYQRLIAGWDPDEFAASFSMHIQVTPTRMRTY